MTNGSRILGGRRALALSALLAVSGLVPACASAPKQTAAMRELQVTEMGSQELHFRLNTFTLHLPARIEKAAYEVYAKTDDPQVRFNILNFGRLKLGVGVTGGCKGAIYLGQQYAKERKQFKTPLAEFGLIREKLAKSTAWTYACESMSYRTAGLVDEMLAKADKSDKQAALKALEEFAIESSIMKVMGSETFAWVVDEMLPYFTERFGNPPVVASSRLPSQMKNRMRTLLFNMHQDPQGKKILKKLMIDRFIAPIEGCYDPILAM